MGVAVILALVLSACSSSTPEPKDPTMDLAEAKTLTQSGERDIAALVPEANAGTVTVKEMSGAIQPCEGGYTWPGLLTMPVTGSVDRAAILASVATEWSGKSGWTVEQRESSSGSATVRLKSSDGTVHSVSFRDDGTEFHISSFSPCFDLGEEYDPGKLY